MEFNAAQQYHHPPSDRPYAMGQSSPAPGTQMLYSYGAHPFQGHQQSQSLQPMSRPSPTQPTWAVPQTHQQYYAMPRGPPLVSTEETEQIVRSNAHASHSPAMSNYAFSNSVDSAGTLATPDYFPGVIDTSPWGQKVCEELEAFPSLDADVADFNHGIIGQDENTPIIDLRQYANMGHQDSGKMPNYNHSHSIRRMSGSSYSLSSTSGVPPETTPYEELGPSEVIPYVQEYETWSHSEPSTQHLLSPLASPRRPRYEGVIRGGSRTRRSPAPHSNVRSSPYTLDSSRYNRWSTGQAPTSTPTGSRTMAQVSDRYTPYGMRSSPHHSMPNYSPSGYSTMYTPAQNNVLYSQTHPLHANNQSLYPQDHSFQLEVPRPVPSQGLFRLLQSSADRHGGCSSHFADLSDPPDLYSSLHEEASNPPESDMNPADPDLVPHEQDLRFVGDLYTPRWVRGHGNKREGWCGLCKPGRWLVLKNSAFWYDKSFTHGVSAATGAAFQGPQDTRRTDGNLDVWEGLCGSCGEWIALVSSKKKGTTWFRHAYKCHTHPKVKDGPKRRRETQAGRVRTVSSTSATPPYPIKKATPQQTDAVSHRHSTPVPITDSGSLLPFGMPSTSSSTPLPQSTTPTATPQLSMSSYPSRTSYRTSASATATSHAIGTPTATSFTGNRMEPSSNYEPVVGLFTTPLQSLSTFSGGQSYSHHLAHQVSEPELVGIRSTTTALNSIASMI